MISIIIGGNTESNGFKTWFQNLPSTQLLLGTKPESLSKFCRGSRESSKMLQIECAYDSPRKKANDPVVVYFPIKASKQQELDSLFPRIAAFIEVAQDYTLDIQVFASKEAATYMVDWWPMHWPPLQIYPPEKNLNIEVKND